jgi:hypothetical protein
VKLNNFPVDIESVQCDNIKEFIEQTQMAFDTIGTKIFKYDDPKRLWLGILLLDIERHIGKWITIKISDARKKEMVQPAVYRDAFEDFRSDFLLLLRCNEETTKYLINKMPQE